MNRALGAALAALFAVGCGANPRVVRVYDGKVVEGPYVPPEAYAAFLRGAISAEAGDLEGALVAFQLASKEDDEDPAIWTRIGEIRCRLDRKDARADEAIGRALALDAGYSQAYAARASCMQARGRAAEAEAAAREAARFDPSNVDVQALVLRTVRTPNAADRARALALTARHGERAAAWEALAAWGRSHGDAELFARGLSGLVRVSPSRSAEAEKGALELLGLGYAAYARMVAAAVADVPRDHGGIGPRDATVARLAVDEAIRSGDRELVERRALRGHVALAEVSARALLRDRRELAASIARDVASADPRDGGASMVLAVLATEPGDLGRAREIDGDVPAVCALALADAIASSSSAEAAGAWLSRITRAPAPLHDPIASRISVDLAARGVLSAGELSAEERIELSARRRESPPPIGSAPPGSIDAKHLFLWHALVDPRSKQAIALQDRFERAADRDAVVGFAVSRVLLSAARAAGGKSGWDEVRRAIAGAPADPLLLAIAVELAKMLGKTDELRPLRERLMAVARTPAERALATE